MTFSAKRLNPHQATSAADEQETELRVGLAGTQDAGVRDQRGSRPDAGAASRRVKMLLGPVFPPSIGGNGVYRRFMPGIPGRCLGCGIGSVHHR